MSSIGKNLKISAVVVIFIVSILGTAIPMLLSNSYSLPELLASGVFVSLKCVASGVILGVAAMHLLPESIEVLSEETEYPVAMVVAVSGIFFALSMDQIALYFIKGVEKSGSSSTSSSKKDSHLALPHLHAAAPTDIEASQHGQTQQVGHLHTPHDCEEEDAKLSQKLAIKAYILEAAMAVHSIIIGFDFGSTNGKEELTTLKILYIAFTFHQLFEGIGLGATLAEASTQLGMTRVGLLIFIFATSFPIGILIGMFTASTSVGEVVAGYASAFVAGVLLHSSLIEMIGQDFLNPVFEDRPFTKLCMFGGLLFGFSVMAILAIWG